MLKEIFPMTRIKGIIQKITSLSWTSAFSSISTFAVRFLLVTLFFFLLVVIYRGLNQKGYALQDFEVPKSLDEAGYNGSVTAYLLQEKISEIKSIAITRRSDSLQVNLDIRPDLNLDIMGVGLSSASIIYHIRELLGRQNNTISGFITDLENEIELTVNMSGFDSKKILVPYKTGEQKEAINEVLYEGGKFVLGNLDPYRLCVYYFNQNDLEKTEKLIRRIIVERPNDRKWAYNIWGNLYRDSNSIEKAKQAFLQSIEEDASFILPVRSMAWMLLQEKNYEEALKYFQKALELNPYENSMDNGAAICHRLLGNLDEAENHYKATLAKFPDIIWSYGNYSDFLMRFRKDTLATVDVWEEAGKNLEISGDYYMARAANEYILKNPEKAMEYAQLGLELEPENVNVLSTFGNFYYNEVKDYNKAAEFTKRRIDVLEKRQYDQNMIISAYNRLAMSQYMMEEFDSSLHYVQIAIDMNPGVNFPYSTKAEAYLLMGELSNFYENIEIAVSKGFDLEPFLDDHPYNLIKDQNRMRAIIDKYKENFALKG